MARFFFGRYGAETLLGTGGSDYVFGFGGNDVIETFGGRDLIFAGSGNDTVYAGSGRDVVFAGSGNDIVYGGSGRDRLYGDSGNDLLDGGTGNDFLVGGWGDDTLIAGAGNDRLYAGFGDDTLVGGDGYDRMYGQRGDDTFVISSNDAVGYRNDYIDGGRGLDTLVLQITSDEFASQAVADDFAAFQSYLDDGGSGTFGFSSFSLSARNVESLRVFVDGVEVDPSDAGPGSVGADPVAVDDVATAVENGRATGNVLSNDTDAGGFTVSLVDATALGTVELTADGSFTFKTGSDFDDLAAGETRDVNFTYQIDGTNETATVTVTVTGTNDAPTVSAALSAKVSEDGETSTLDLLAGSQDVDGDALTVSLSGPLPAGVTLDGSALNLNPADTSFQGLAAGETVDIVIDFDIVDGNGGSVSQTATFTVTGTNDAPVVDGALSASADEGGSGLTVDLLAGADDVDGDTLSVSFEDDLPAGVSVDGTTLILDPSDPAFDGLAVDETIELVVSYQIEDPSGAAVQQSVTLTVTGTNDAPFVAVALSAVATEDGASVSLDLSERASDVDGDTLSITVDGALPAGVGLSGTTLTLDPSDAAFQALAEGELQHITVSYTVTDINGASAPGTATFTVTGTNDGPIVDGDLSAGATEDGAAVTLDVTAGATDLDGETITASIDGELPAGVTLNGNALTLDPSDAAYQSLSAGETLDINVEITLSDDSDGTASRTATFTLTGANDTPTVTGAISASTTEGGNTVSVDLLDGASDVDAGDTLTVVLPPELPDGVSVNGDTLSLDPTDAAYDALGEGKVTQVVVDFTIEDGQGGSVAQSVTFTVTGTNDVPTVEAALTAATTEGGASVSIDLLSGASDADANDRLSVADLGELPAGLSLEGNVLTLDATDPSFDALAEGEELALMVAFTVSDGMGGETAQSATFTVTGTNDAPSVETDLSISVDEDELGVSVSLLEGATDVDTGDTLAIENVTGLRPGVSLLGDNVDINVFDSSFDTLSEGDSEVITISYDVVDSQGARVAQTLTITVNGTNDAPVIGDTLIARAIEGEDTATIDLLTGATDVDSNDTLSITNVSALPAGLSLNGTTLSLDATNPTFDDLAAGEILELTVNYDVIDGNGGVVAQSATFTIEGTNDAPVVAGALSAGADEDGDDVTLDLLSGATDVDTAELSVTNVSPLPAGVTLDGTTLSVDPSDAAFQSLAVDGTAELTVSFSVIDSFGGEVAQTAFLTITGANDAPTVTASLSDRATEGGDAASVNLLDGASDVDTTDTLSISDLDALPAGVTRDGDTLTLDPTDAAYDRLAVGETQDVVVNYTITDGNGGIVAQSVTFTVVGTNDAPVVAGALSSEANEDDAEIVIELLDGASDVDTDELSVTNVSELPAGVTVDGTTLRVDPSDASFQSLAVGRTTEIIVNFTITDGLGGEVPQTATITVTGTNDAPTVAAALSASAVEGGSSVSIDLLDGATDVDATDRLSVSDLGTLPAGVSLDGSVLSLDPLDPAYDGLAAGETLDVVVNYNVIDGQGGTVAQSATFSLTGTNDAPVVAAPVVAATDEDADTLTLDLLVGASDVDTATLSVTNVSELPSGVTLDGTTLSVDPGDASLQSLAVGETTELVVSYTVTDGLGGNVAQTATITVTGTNDQPVVEAALSAAATEDAATVSLDLLAGASDVDATDTLSVADLDALPAGLSLVGTVVTLDPADAAFDSLAVGEVLDIILKYNVVDGQGGTVAQTATFSVTGTNDAPVVEAALSADATEGAQSVTVDLLDGATDVDATDRLSVSITGELPAGVTLNGSAVTFDPNDVAYDALAADELLDVVISYDVLDGNGGTVSQTLTFSVTGTNDTPVVASSLSASTVEDGEDLSVELLDGASDVDNGATLSVANLTGLVDGVTLGPDNTVLVDADNAAFHDLAVGEVRDIELNYDVVDETGASVAQTLTLSITGANDAPTVAAALSADATEDGASVSLTLLDGSSDVDGDTLSVEIDEAALPAGVTFDGTALTIDPSGDAYQFLAAGEALDVSVDYTVTDGNGGSLAQSATFVVAGTNDGPTVAEALVLGATEDTTTDFDLLAGANDVDLTDTLTVSAVQGLVDGVTVDGTTLTVDAADGSFQALAEGETLDIELSYDVVDSQGASVPQTATLTITGANDAPVVAAALAFAFSEDTFARRFDLLVGATDIDAGAELSVALADGATLPDGFSFDGTDLIVAAAANADIQALNAGEELDIVVDFLISDQNGASVPQSLTLTFTGENDAPRLTQSFGLQELPLNDAFSLVLPTDLFTDVDAGDSVSVTASLPGGDALPAWLSFDPATGTLSGTPAEGDAGGLNVLITGTDQSGASRSTTITFAIGDGVIVGTDEADDLLGTDEADVFFGGTGNDRMEGTGGNDTYVFNIGDGQDTVDDKGFRGLDTLQFNGRNFDDATITRDGNSETIVISFDNGDSVTVIDALADRYGNIERLIFDDTTLDVDAIRAAVIAAYTTIGDDVTFGTFTEDNFAGSTGNDTLVGGDSSDTYVFNIGDGQDTVDDQGFRSLDTVVFAGRDFADATITREGDSETVTFNFDNGDSVTLVNALADRFGNIEQVVFDDGPLDVQQFRDAVIAALTSDGDDVTFGTFTDDEFAGSTGNDTLSGGEGNDTYVFNIGDGQDTVDDNGFRGVDTVVFAGRDFADATITREGDSETVTYNFDNGDSVTLVDALADRFGNIEQIVFDDGPLTTAEFRAAVINAFITDGDDTTFGTFTDDEFASSTGNDTLQGGLGSDTYVFNIGDGQDTVDDSGFRSTDTIEFVGRDRSDAVFVRDGTSNTYSIIFANGDSVRVVDGIDSNTGGIERIVFRDGPLDVDGIRAALLESNATNGDDEIIGTAADETLIGLQGNDTLVGGDGSDTYIFNIGDGQDIVDDNGFGDTDIIQINGRTFEEATFTRLTEGVAGDFEGSYLISFDNGDSIEVRYGLGGFGSDTIEEIRFQNRTLNPAEIRQILVDQAATAENDSIIGFNAGEDRIEGGTGADFLSGQDGSDTYIFNIGDGQDVVDDNGSGDTDVIQFVGRDIEDATITLVRDGVGGDFPGTILFSFENGDSVEVRYALFNYSSDTIERYLFDNADLSAAELAQLIVDRQVTDGADIVTGTDLGDVIDGGTGNDTLSGGDGSDQYVFEIGDGQDIVDDNGSNDADSLVFVGRVLADATFSNVVREPDGTLEYTLTFDNGDSVEVNRAISSASDAIESLVFDDTTLTGRALVDAVIAGNITDGDDTVLGSLQADTIDGGTGNDFLSGGDGSDQYMFEIGDGQDFVDDEGSNDTDELVFLGRTLDSFTVSRLARTDDGTLEYTLSFDNGDSVQVNRAIGSTSDGIERLVFDDGTLEGQALTDAIIARAASDGDDALVGSLFGDLLIGGLGNDTLSGGDGADTYVFNIGDGQDIVDDDGNFDNDTLQFIGRDYDAATFAQSGTGFTITFDNGDSVEVVGGLGTRSDGIESLVFDNGTFAVSDIDFPGGVINGTEEDDSLTGGSGDDEINGLGGDDFIRGEDGNDIINGGSGNDDLNGGAGDDTINGGDGGDIISGGSGNDTIDGGSGEDDLNGGSGNDVITDGDGDGDVYGDGGDDTIIAGAGDDYYEGGDGEDTYIFSAGFGNDELDDFGSSDETDTIRFLDLDLADAAFTVNNDGIGDGVTISFNTGDVLRLPYALDDGSDQIELFEFRDQTLTVEDVRNLLGQYQGTDGDDTIVGQDVAETLSGGAGNDNIDGAGGDDEIYGGDGNDTLIGGEGDDSLFGDDGDDVLTGGTGDDVLTGGRGMDRYEFGQGDGQDTIDTTFGEDTIDLLVLTGYDRADATITASGQNDLLINFGNGDSVTIERFFREDYGQTRIVFDDGTVLTRSQLSAEIIAAQVSDSDDTVFGTDASDRIEAGTGDDALFGGRGDDNYVYNPGDGNDTITDGLGNNTIDFGTYEVADATINADGPGFIFLFEDGGTVTIDPVQFAPGEFSIINNYVFADQTLSFGEMLAFVTEAEPLILVGDDDANLLVGASTNDTLTGGRGNDRLVGGTGDDLYVFNAGDGADVIFDEDGNDTLEINGYVAAQATFRNVAQGIEMELANGDSVLIELPPVGVIGGEEGPIFGRPPFVENFEFDDITLTLDDVFDLLSQGVVGETFNGTPGNDTLVGTRDNDSVFGGEGNDILDGGEGNDLLEGGLGDDTYLFELGDGADFVDDEGGADELVLIGVQPGDVFLDSNLIGGPGGELGGDGEGIIGGAEFLLSIFSETGAFSEIEITAGSIETITLVPDPANPDVTISATFEDVLNEGPIAFYNRVDGTEASETVTGTDGSDLIDGGAGNDTLVGGLGDDQYVYAEGDGNDTIVDAGGYDTLLLLGYNRFDAFGAFTIGFGENDDGGPVLILSNGEGEETTIAFNEGGIDGFIFQSDPDDADSREFVSFEELFGDDGGPFGPGGPLVDGGDFGLLV